MTKKATGNRYVGFFKTILSPFRSKWKLVNEIEMQVFYIGLQDKKIDDLNNRLEAYKDAIISRIQVGRDASRNRYPDDHTKERKEKGLNEATRTSIISSSVM